MVMHMSDKNHQEMDYKVRRESSVAGYECKLILDTAIGVNIPCKPLVLFYDSSDSNPPKFFGLFRRWKGIVAAKFKLIGIL